MYKKMEEALKMAKKAYKKDEVPIGAVLYRGDELIAKAHNQCVEKNDPLAHAEMLVIKKALKKLNTTYLNDCELYVTVEPCMMCMGAVLNTRIKKLVYGIAECKTGFVDSLINICSIVNCRHIKIYGGIKEEECKILMANFFSSKRN
jgi:tRNA(adenine34) deaminase